ncbi:retinoid-inducible serine carboxypeptidase-like [Cylas formicarius]|uniref:retinoid-inducible serine carboxypeptidase-like n=1 Tax=Cylas formicarius TaxID=197179 RepID=UPI0029586D29|nr:retinoid-inducible serine carboxypeptidase-like [Cylas formicarius]
MKVQILILLSVVVSTLVHGRKGFGPGEQDWGYIKVREKSYMFWWLYYTTASSDAKDRPLIIWLQGGPGGSSTGLGNFNEIGPWDVHLQNRSFSWVNFANILFVDNPVGTGFSYIEEGSDGFAKDNAAIARDFLEFLNGFFEKFPDFQSVPLYIFGQSYGGKMAVDIALLLVEKVRNGGIQCNLKGLGLGDAWISPLNSLLSWPEYLFNLGFIDSDGLELVSIVTSIAEAEYSNEHYENVTKLFLVTQIIINDLTNHVNFYNILSKTKKYLTRDSSSSWGNHYLPDRSGDEALNKLMNNEVKSALNINSTIQWGAQGNYVFKAVEADMMKPVTNGVERILNDTNLTVAVYNGQLDLIVATPGTLKWVDNLKWNKANEWTTNTLRKSFAVGHIIEGYEKSTENLHLYWVNRAGHSVPADNPAAMEYILRQTTNNFNVDN